MSNEHGADPDADRAPSEEGGDAVGRPAAFGDRSRRTVFAMAAITGFLCMGAALSALQFAGNVTVASVLIILGSFAFSFGALVVVGRFDWLFAT